MEVVQQETKSTDKSLLKYEQNDVENDAPIEKVEEKRKSVSFVDEKLIINAIKSASINEKSTENCRLNQQNTSPKQKNDLNSSHNKRAINNKHPSQYFSENYNPNHKHQQINQKKYFNRPRGDALRTSSSNQYSNPVIIYYSNPEVEINVDDLINKAQAHRKQEQELKMLNAKSNCRKPKTQVSQLSLSNNQNNSTDFNKYTANNNQRGNYLNQNDHRFRMGVGQKQTSGALSDNWQNHLLNYHQPKHLQQKYSNNLEKFSTFHGKKSGAAGSFKNLHHSKNSKNHQSKSNVTMSTDKKVEAITIYYNDNSVSLEENLKRLKQTWEKTSGTENEINRNNENTKTNGRDSSQSTVINDDKIQQVDEIISTSNSTEELFNLNICKLTQSKKFAISEPETLVVSHDPEDVISGGVSIENARLPACRGPHLVVCTLVSHPGHFYIKFLNDEHEKQLMAMNQFYQLDEHIDLTLDVLKPGQYFAARCNQNVMEGDSKWIRVKLLYVESSDSINCFLIDQGCFAVFKLNQLQPLYNQFRSVPKQAIRVSLSGIRSKESDWLPNEALEFKKLVENRKLKTGNIGNGQQQIKITDSESVLEIELFFADDQGNGESLLDRNVADVLIERDLATRK